MSSKINSLEKGVPLQQTKPIAYGRMRRWLGIVYVGVLVSLALLGLKLDLPRTMFSTTQQGLGSLALELAAAVSIFALATLPLDLAGFQIEKKYEKSNSKYLSFIGKQIAANFRHGAVLLVVALLTAMVNRSFGLPGLALWSVIGSCLVVAGQLNLVNFYGEVRDTAVESSKTVAGEALRAQVAAVQTDERCFTGGIAGLPWQEKIVIPQRWLRELSAQQLEALLRRREAVISSGMRLRGLLIAALFTCSGILIACALTEHCFSLIIDTAAGLVTMSALFTLWSFIGLVSLPSITHLAVYEADRLAIKNGVSDSSLKEAIARIDEEMGEESWRTAAVDNIFHPIPTAAHRLNALNQNHLKNHRLAAWQAARYALFLSVIGLGLLGRAVHCNAGKPELWAMMPAD